MAARRKQGEHMEGLWEFPGGKVEEGEQPEDCLVRELREELEIHCRVGSFFAESCHDYGSKKIRLLCYFVEYLGDTFTLNDHDKIIWLPPHQLLQLNWAPADIPVVKKLVKDAR